MDGNQSRLATHESICEACGQVFYAKRKEGNKYCKDELCEAERARKREERKRVLHVAPDKAWTSNINKAYKGRRTILALLTAIECERDIQVYCKSRQKMTVKAVMLRSKFGRFVGECECGEEFLVLPKFGEYHCACGNILAIRKASK